MFVADHCSLLINVRCWSIFVADHCSVLIIVSCWSFSLLINVRCWLIFVADHCSVLIIVSCWSLFVADQCSLLINVRCRLMLVADHCLLISWVSLNPWIYFLIKMRKSNESSLMVTPHTRHKIYEEVTRVTSHSYRIFQLSRVPSKSKAKYQSVTWLISYFSVLMSTLPEHNRFYLASVVSTWFNNFHENSWSYCHLFFIFGGPNYDCNVW